MTKGGTRAGGLKAAATNKQRHGKNFYVKIGAMGGKVGGGKGGFRDVALAKRANRLSGIKKKSNA